MSISPSTLFHFTTKEALKNILKENFKLKYCLEKLPNGEDEGRIAIPMVSFCDIKISEIVEHITKYGEYGIGLKKTWAVEKGLSPVFYQILNSTFSIGFKEKIPKIMMSDNPHAVDIMYDFLRLSKEYEGKLVRNGETINEAYRYADEREWRYIPKLKKSLLPFSDFLLEKDYNTMEKKHIANQKLSNERLYFNANDIMYLIVKNDDDIAELISHIRTVKGKNYSMEEIDRLTTRIITCERIIQDF